MEEWCLGGVLRAETVNYQGFSSVNFLFILAAAEVFLVKFELQPLFDNLLPINNTAHAFSC